MELELSERVSPDCQYLGMMAQVFYSRDPQPKLVITPDCEVIWHSESAPELLTRPYPMRLEDGRLRFEPHIRPERLQRFFEDLGDSHETCLIRGVAKGTWIILWAKRLEMPKQAIGIVCTLSGPCRNVAESGLSKELNLTSTETRVLDCFAELSSPKDIAEQLGISIATVRSHLKQIYSKASVESAVQLLQLTRSYCGG